MRDPRTDPREGDILYTPVGQLLHVEAVYPNHVIFKCDEILRISPLSMWRAQSARDNTMPEVAVA